MDDVEPYLTAAGVEAAIKEAAKKARAADPSLTVNERIRLVHFNRFLSRVFSEGAESEWLLKGGTGLAQGETRTKRRQCVRVGTEDAVGAGGVAFGKKHLSLNQKVWIILRCLNRQDQVKLTQVMCKIYPRGQRRLNVRRGRHLGDG
ncbi:MAG: hypothetical protein LH630_06120 [Actinomycetia bacterium]|nr:hypothetical protein [Actinomycetes bacterium]